MYLFQILYQLLLPSLVQNVSCLSITTEILNAEHKKIPTIVRGFPYGSVYNDLIRSYKQALELENEHIYTTILLGCISICSLLFSFYIFDIILFAYGPIIVMLITYFTSLRYRSLAKHIYETSCFMYNYGNDNDLF